MKRRVGITTPDAGLDRAYVDAVIAAGGLPVVLPILSPADAADLVGGLDALLFTGGGDIDPSRYGAVAHPDVYGVDERRDDWELALAIAAVAADLPVLGVCRGAQVMNVALGGSLVQHLPDITGVGHRERERAADDVHVVTLQTGSRVASVLGADRLAVNSLHHQAAELIGTGLRVVAVADDGTVEALEGVDGRIIGVQWHPELLAARRADQAALFGWLVTEASETREELPASL